MMTRTFLGVLLIVFLFAGSGIAVWHWNKDRINRRAVYRLHASRVIVPTTPEWIPSDFVRSVIQDSGLDVHGTLLDKDLPQRLAAAFAADPWVESVQRVEIVFPGGADVRLTYRRPVALVEIAPRGFLPVDRHGIVLPTEFFHRLEPAQRLKFLRIQGIRSTPLGNVGTLWGDLPVHEAAGLADSLSDVADELELFRIQPEFKDSSVGRQTVFRIWTRSGTEINWGRFLPEGPETGRKKKSLLELNERYRSLDRIPEQNRPIDLSLE